MLTQIEGPTFEPDAEDDRDFTFDEWLILTPSLPGCLALQWKDSRTLLSGSCGMAWKKMKRTWVLYMLLIVEFLLLVSAEWAAALVKVIAQFLIN